MLIELKVKPLEWTQDRFGTWIAHGIECEYQIEYINESNEYYCKVELNDKVAITDKTAWLIKESDIYVLWLSYTEE